MLLVPLKVKFTLVLTGGASMMSPLGHTKSMVAREEGEVGGREEGKVGGREEGKVGGREGRRGRWVGGREDGWEGGGEGGWEGGGKEWLTCRKLVLGRRLSHHQRHRDSPIDIPNEANATSNGWKRQTYSKTHTTLSLRSNSDLNHANTIDMLMTSTLLNDINTIFIISDPNDITLVHISLILTCLPGCGRGRQHCRNS